MTDSVFLLLGIAGAAAGGEFFVRGTLGLARWARVSPAIVSATLAAFATSSPEFAVSVNAALAGGPQLGLGDALGSNVVNVALILGLAVAFAGMPSPRETVRREFPFALLAPVLTGGLLLDGRLGRFDAVLMLGLFLWWLGAVASAARRQRRDTPANKSGVGGGRALVHGAAGLAVLLIAGRLIVTGATGLAVAHGWDRFVIGATVVAVGTSVPELATVLMAALRGHVDVSLGTVLGSNLFNGLCIAPVAALICPIAVGWRETGAVLGLGVVAVGLTFPPKDGQLTRTRGVALLATYAVYLTIVLLQGGAESSS